MERVTWVTHRRVMYASGARWHWRSFRDIAKGRIQGKQCTRHPQNL